MAYFGKEFVLERHENFEEFIDSLGQEVPAQVRKAIIDFKPTTKVVKNGDEYTTTNTRFDGQTAVATFKSGAETDETIMGRKAKVTNLVDGNTFTSILKFDVGITLTFKKEFSDNDMVVTVTTNKWDGEAKRYYKAK